MAISILLPFSKVSADTGDSSYLYEITSRCSVNNRVYTLDNNTDTFPLKYTVIAFSGFYSEDDIIVKYQKAYTSTSYLSASVQAVLHTDNLTYIILAGDDEWHALQFNKTVLGIYLLMDNSLSPGSGTISLSGSSSTTANLPGTISWLKTIEENTYSQFTIQVNLSTVTSSVLADKWHINLTGTFSDFQGINMVNFIPYSYTMSYTLNATPGYSFSIDGKLTDTVTLTGTTHQVGESTIHTGDLYVEGNYSDQGTGNMLHATNTRDIDITVPDSNVELSGTQTINIDQLEGTGIPTTAIDNIICNLQIIFSEQPPSSLQIKLGKMVYSDTSAGGYHYISGSYLIRYRELPANDTAYANRLLGYVKSINTNMQSRVLNALTSNWSNNEKPFFTEWLEKIYNVLNKDLEDDTKNEYQENADRLDQMSGQLAEGDAVSDSLNNIEFSAPSLDSNSLLIVMLTETWSWSVFADFVGTLVAVAVLAYMIFQKKE